MLCSILLLCPHHRHGTNLSPKNIPSHLESVDTECRLPVSLDSYSFGESTVHSLPCMIVIDALAISRLFPAQCLRVRVEAHVIGGDSARIERDNCVHLAIRDFGRIFGAAK